MDDLIDFSERDDEFLDKELQQKTLAFAIISAVLGFAISSFLFLGTRRGPAAGVLDRRAAEGRVVTSSQRSDGAGPERFLAFQAPQLKTHKKTTRRRPAWKDLTVVASLSQTRKAAPAGKKRQERRVLEASVGGVPEYARKKRSAPVRSTTPRKTVRREDSTDRLLYPVVDDRPGHSSLTSVERAVGPNLIVLGNLQGEYQVGFGIDASGTALVSSQVCTPEYLDRIWVNGTLRRAEVKAVDPEFGIALIQVSGANFSTIPLAPVPPLGGEHLLSFTTRGRGTRSFECRSALSFGRAGFFLEGDFDNRQPGSPVLNDRGELVGCYVHSLPGTPGTGFNLAADSAALYRLQRGYQGGGSIGSLESEAASRLEDFLASVESEGEIRRGRVLPGIGLSDFHLGMSTSGAERWASTPEKTSMGAGLELWRTPAPPVTLYFVNGRLALAATDHNGFSTPDGLSPGATTDMKKLAGEYVDIEVYSRMVCAAGLDIGLSPAGKVTQFVVKPELARQ